MKCYDISCHFRNKSWLFHITQTTQHIFAVDHIRANNSNAFPFNFYLISLKLFDGFILHTCVNFQMLKIVRNIHMGLGFIPWEAVPTILASTWDGCCDTGLVTWIHSPEPQPPTMRASSPCPEPKSWDPDTRLLNRRVAVTKAKLDIPGLKST